MVKAEDPTIRRQVAIKLIRADLDRSDMRARLQVEARAAAKLGHPAIVRIFDISESASVGLQRNAIPAEGARFHLP